MNNIDQEMFDEAVLEVTSGTKWEVIQSGLRNDIYHAQASALECKSWDDMNKLRGFVEGLNYVINMRDIVEQRKSVFDDAAL